MKTISQIGGGEKRNIESILEELLGMPVKQEGRTIALSQNGCVGIEANEELTSEQLQPVAEFIFGWTKSNADQVPRTLIELILYLQRQLNFAIDQVWPGYTEAMLAAPAAA